MCLRTKWRNATQYVYHSPFPQDSLENSHRTVLGNPLGPHQWNVPLIKITEDFLKVYIADNSFEYIPY